MISAKSIFKNLSASSVGLLVNLGIQFIGVPLFIKFWGVEMYGEWLVLTAITSYFSMTDIGLSTVTANEFSIRFAERDYLKCQMLYNNNLFFVVGIFSAIFSFLLLSGWFLDWKSLLRLQILDKQEVFLSVFLLIAHIFFGMLSSLLNSIYRAKQRYSRAIMLDNGVRVFENVLLIFGLVLGLSIVPVLLLYTCARIFVFLFKFFDTRKLHFISIGIHYVNWKELKLMASPSFVFLAFPIGNAILLQGFTLLVNFILGSKVLVLYNTTRTLVNFIKSGLSLVSNSVWPEFSLAFGRKDISGMRKLHQYAVGLSFYISIFSILILLFMGKYIYILWLGVDIEFDSILFYSFLLTLVANTVWYTSSVVLVATNQHTSFAIYFFFGSLISIFLAYIMLNFGLKISYLPFSLLILDILMIVTVFRQTIKVVDDTFKNFLVSFLVCPINVLNKVLK